MSAKLSSVLRTIEQIKEIYPFEAEQTFMDLDREDLSRRPQVSLRTFTDEGFDIQVRKLVTDENY